MHTYTKYTKYTLKRIYESLAFPKSRGGAKIKKKGSHHVNYNFHPATLEENYCYSKFIYEIIVI